MRLSRIGVAILLATPSLSFPASDADALAAVRQEIDRRAAGDRFSGVVLVARGGTAVLQEARGFADAERRAPITMETRFNLGSMSKMFTAVAVAQLAQAGKLKFTDTIGQHLPDYPNKDAAARVTIHHLLTHTGGVGDFFGPGYETRRDGLMTLADYVLMFAAEPLRFEPGARWEYSNGGFIVLGAIIEKVSGRSYYDYVRERVFEPAGMTQTASFAKTERPANTAAGLTRIERGHHGPGRTAGPRRSNLDMLPGRGSSAGGGYSTAGDLLRFANALLAHKLLDREHTDLAVTGKAPTPRGKYGYGFIDRVIAGQRVVGHGGGFPGVNAELHILPETRHVVVVLSNYDPPAATQLADFVVERLGADALRLK